jgi:glycine/D-amino acid oxidase-like deaminating enzyme
MTDKESPGTWLDAYGGTPYQPNPALESDIRADVAIVGGGYTGLSTAYYLRRSDPSLRVVVLESNFVGYGASGRNGGCLKPQLGLGLSSLVRRLGLEGARSAHKFMLRAVDHVGQIIREHDIDCEYGDSGLLMVACNSAEVKRVQAEMRLAHRLGMEEVRWLEGEEVRSEVNSPLFLAGIEEHCRVFNPLKLVRGMKGMAESAGAEIYEGTPVQALHTQPRLRLETPSGSAAADKVVLATNAFSGRIRQLRGKALPLFVYAVATEPLSEEQLAAVGWRRRHWIYDGRRIAFGYRLTSDNRLRIGVGDIAYFYGGSLDHPQHRPARRLLEKRIAEVFPSLAGVPTAHHWGGPVSFPLDFFPAMGYLGSNQRVVYSLGYMGWGVPLATIAGQILRDLVRGERSELTELPFVNRRVIPLPPEPLRSAFVQAVRGAMQAEDGWAARKVQREQQSAGIDAGARS